MPEIYSYNPNDVIVPPRQRGHFEPEYIAELAASIKSIGQLQPGVCRRDDEGRAVLIAGECRLRACAAVGTTFNFYFKEDITDPAMLYECELMENLIRKPLTWREEVEAKAQWHELRQAQRGGTASGRRGGHTIEDTANELHESKGLVSEDLKIAYYAREIPEVANATNKADAKKIVKKLESEYERTKLLEAVKEKEKTASAGDGASSLSLVEAKLLEYDKRVILADFNSFTTDKVFDVILFDPPWGVDFDTVSLKNESQNMYEDSKESFESNFPIWLKKIYDLMAENAHLYVFFGIANYNTVYSSLAAAGFDTNGIPLIWYKQGSHRTRNPKVWPGRSYEPIAFARKGKKNLEKQGSPDVIITPQPTPKIKQSHPSAKHPAIYRELLMRSCLPGDRVLDPMAGSCMAAVAADSLKTSHALDWIMVEKEQTFRDLGVFNLNKGFWQIVDDATGLDPDEEVSKTDEDFRKLEPGSKEWMNFWRLNPSKQAEMIEFRAQMSVK